jgi:mannose-1-phosphate guanylyltransferase
VNRAACRSPTWCSRIELLHHALVLTAGLGTRLRPLTDVRAKPAIPVAGEPMIRRIIASLASHGVTDLVLNLHHRPDTIAAVVGNGSDLGVRVRYSWEQPMVLGSGGGPRLALPIVGTDVFLIVNGDTLTDVDVPALARAHDRSDALVTLALVPNREFDRYGGVRLDDDGRVVGFVARGPAAQGSYHYIGVQVAEAEVFAGVRAGEAVRSIGGVYDALMAARPGSVRGFVSDAAFWDVGTITDYWRTWHAFSELPPGSDPNPGSDPKPENRAIWGQTPVIDRSARVTDSILWDDVEIGADAAVDECILTDGVRVPAGATYRRMAIVRDAAGRLAASPFDTGFR